MGLDETGLSTPKAPEVRLGQRERLMAEKRLAGASADEIASELGIKASSVRSTMHVFTRNMALTVFPPYVRSRSIFPRQSNPLLFRQSR